MFLLSNVPSPYLSPVYARLKAAEDENWKVCYVSAWNGDVGWSPESAANFMSANDILLAEKHPALWRYFGTQVAAAYALLRELIKTRVDYCLVYGYTRLPQLLLIGWAAFFNIPFAIAGDANYYLDNASGWRRLLKRKWLGWLTGRAAALIAVGTACRKFWQAYGATPTRIFHVGFAVDNDHFREASEQAHPRANALKQEWGWQERTVFLYVGRLIERKNVHQLIAVAQELRDLPIAILIAGDGEQRSRLEEQAADHRYIKFVGAQTQAELPLMYALSDVLVLPARAEPWGLVINEAMACGLAVVAHEHCGAAEDLVGNENGVRLRTFEVRELAEALRLLVQDSEQLLQRKQKSREIIQAWSMAQAATQLRDAINKTREGRERARK